MKKITFKLNYLYFGAYLLYNTPSISPLQHTTREREEKKTVSFTWVNKQEQGYIWRNQSFVGANKKIPKLYIYIYIYIYIYT